MNVLHLINGAVSQTDLAALGDGLAALGGRRRVWLLGDGSARQRAERVGLGVERVLTMPSAMRPMAVLPLWRELCKTHGELIHTWMLPRLARWALPVERVVVESAAVTEIEGREIEPAIDARRIGREGRERMRMAWGVTDEKMRVVAALGEPGRVDALQAVLAVGLAAETGRGARLLIGPEARGLDRAQRVMRNAGRDRLLIVDEAVARPWEVLGGCDLVLSPEGGAAAAWGMAAGLADVESLCAERLAGRMAKHEAAAAEMNTGENAGEVTDHDDASENDGSQVSGASHAGELARAVCRLIDNSALAAQRGEAARLEAAERFAPSHFADRLRGVYEKAATQKALLKPAAI